MKQTIEYLLFRSGISNYQISQATGISQVVLSKYETGKSDVGRMTLDNAIKLNNYYKEWLKMMENKNGTVEFEAKKYILIDQADFSGRQLLDWQTEEGYAHFRAPAVDGEGNEYVVEWVLKTVYENGEGIEDLSELDWNNVDNVIKL
jgi:transcriptional regulator with XRE-family HTH domain